MFDKKILLIRKTTAVFLCLALLPFYTHSVLAAENDTALVSLASYGESAVADSEIDYELPAVRAVYKEERGAAVNSRPAPAKTVKFTVTLLFGKARAVRCSIRRT